MNIKIIKNKKVKKILITSMTAVTIINSSPISIFADNEGNKVGEPNIVNNKLTNTENKDQTDDTSSKSDETELNHALNVDEKDADIKNDKSTNLENKDNINDTNPKFDETELNYALNADEKDADIKNDKSTNTENKDNINDANPKSNKTEIKATGTLVEIPDNNLKAELNKKIGQADGLPIYSSQLEQIRGKLTIVKKDIQNLEGIQYCTNIQELDLRNNNISDLSPLGSLTNLQYLNLDNNKLSNIGPLGSLTNLNALYLGNNKINNISPLSSLTNLNTLGLGNNKLDDISSLSSLSKLKTLYLQSNIISNISSLSSLTNLNTLNLNNNKINNVKPLSSLINLKTLTLDNNYIINIRDLKVLSNLTKLSISGQKHILESKDALYKKKFKIENPIIDTNGFVSNITQISDNGRYNNLDSSIEWENLTNDKNLTFSFDKNISIGHASGVFSGTVTQPVKISKSSYNVTYDSNGGSNVSQESVEEESLIQKPADPTKEGYTFAGWYTDETFKTEWNFDTDKMPSKDITLYAKWNVNNYNVTYDSNGGTSVPQESVDYNAKVSRPTNPTKEGYTFAGWYTDETFKTEWNFDTDKMPSKDITLYAKWTLKWSGMNNTPVINVENKTIKAGTEFNPMDGVTATDTEDGNLTNDIKIIENTVNTKKPGTYKVVYEVTDKQGAKTRKTITVTVLSNDKTIISGADNTSIVEGTKFNPMDGVTATDTEDGNLTNDIKVTGNVDVNKPGKYELTYTVTDTDGNTTTVKRTIIVNPKMVEINAIPVITAENKTIKVGDKFNPMEGVTATDKENGNLTNDIKIIENTVDTSKPGTYTVKYEITDKQGAKSTKTITVTVINDTIENSTNNNTSTGSKPSSNQNNIAGNNETTMNKPTNSQQINQVVSNNNANPKTSDAGVLGYLGVGLASLTGLFINRKKKNENND